jgi:hypothetical protein
LYILRIFQISDLLKRTDPVYTRYDRLRKDSNVSEGETVTQEQGLDLRAEDYNGLYEGMIKTQCVLKREREENKGLRGQLRRYREDGLAPFG